MRIPPYCVTPNQSVKLFLPTQTGVGLTQQYCTLRADAIPTISENIRKGNVQEAFRCVRNMLNFGTNPNQFTPFTIVKPIKEIHALITKTGLNSNAFYATNLINMYSKCKRFEDAWQVFDEMSYRDIVSWCEMISACSQCGRLEEAFLIFRQMRGEGMGLDSFALSKLLKACSGSINLGSGLHALALQSGLQSDPFIESALVNMYAKFGDLENANLVFGESGKPNCISWNSLISGYAQIGFGEDALRLFCRMVSATMKPNEFTFASVFKVCSGLGLIESGKCIHCLAIKLGCESEIFVGSALLDMYAKCHSMNDACQVFERMAFKNVICYNTIIVGHVGNGDPLGALEMFLQLLGKSVKPDMFSFSSALSACCLLKNPVLGTQIHAQVIKHRLNCNVYVANCLVNMYAKSGAMESACNVFNGTSNCNPVLWTSLMSGFTQNGFGEKALKLLSSMRWAGVRPDGFTFSSAVTACASLGASDYGSCLHALIIKAGFVSNVFVSSSLIDMYSKSGKIECATKVFDHLPERCVVSWNTMITAYAQHGLGEEALSLFYRMLRTGTKPTEITFIGVLYACTHLGLVDEGFCLFDLMTKEFAIEPRVEHYTCMINLLGHGGFLSEAKDFVSKVPFQTGDCL